MLLVSRSTLNTRTIGSSHLWAEFQVAFMILRVADGIKDPVAWDQQAGSLVGRRSLGRM